MESTGSPSKPFEVTIVGGGLGGIVLAIGLMQRNIAFHIYEAAAAFGEIGAGVAFGPNAIRALDLTSPLLTEVLNRHATDNDDAELATTFLSVARGTAEGGPFGEHLFHLKSSAASMRGAGPVARRSVHRARFLNDIAALLPPDSATFGKSVAAVEDAEDGGYLLKFADGTTATAAVLVGYDGIRSPTRRYVQQCDAPPVFTGDTAYRALAPLEAVEEAVGHQRAANGHLYVGRGGYMLTYPIDHGQRVNMIAVLHQADSQWSPGPWIQKVAPGSLRTDFDGWDPALVKLIETYNPGEKWGLFDTLPSCGGPYTRHRACLAGDAAHATTPHLGAGAGMAFEDAYVLCSLLEDTESLEGIDAAFKSYDNVRRARGEGLVNSSRRAMQAYAQLGPGVGNDFAVMERVLTELYEWVWVETLNKSGIAKHNT